MEEVSAGGGYASSVSVDVHFGLGAAGETDVEVFWPSGTKQSIDTVKSGRIVVVNEPFALH